MGERLFHGCSDFQSLDLIAIRNRDTPEKSRFPVRRIIERVTWSHLPNSKKQCMFY
jgi:hypothetical protein